MPKKKKIKEVTSLTTRQQATYDLIVRNSELGYSTTQKEICDNYPFDPDSRKDGYVWNDNPKSHDHCSTIWRDINAINSYRKSKPIIFSDYIYKVAESLEEVKEFVREYYWDKAMSALWRYGNLLRKAKRDGTIDLFDENEEYEFFEAYVKKMVEIYEEA